MLAGQVDQGVQPAQSGAAFIQPLLGAFQVRFLVRVREKVAQRLQSQDMLGAGLMEGRRENVLDLGGGGLAQVLVGQHDLVVKSLEFPPDRLEIAAVATAHNQLLQPAAQTLHALR